MTTKKEGAILASLLGFVNRHLPAAHRLFVETSHMLLCPRCGARGNVGLTVAYSYPEMEQPRVTTWCRVCQKGLKIGPILSARFLIYSICLIVIKAKEELT